MFIYIENNHKHKVKTVEELKRFGVPDEVILEADTFAEVAYGATLGPDRFIFNDIGYKIPFVRAHEEGHVLAGHLTHRMQILQSKYLRAEVEADLLACNKIGKVKALEGIVNIYKLLVNRYGNEHIPETLKSLRIRMRVLRKYGTR